MQTEKFNGRSVSQINKTRNRSFFLIYVPTEAVEILAEDWGLFSGHYYEFSYRACFKTNAKKGGDSLLKIKGSLFYKRCVNGLPLGRYSGRKYAEKTGLYFSF